jgi:hypothetical protein
MQSISGGALLEIRRLIRDELDTAFTALCERNPELRNFLCERQTWEADRNARSRWETRKKNKKSAR